MNYGCIAIELVVAIIIGAISSYWASGTESFIIGLLTFFSIEVIRMRFDIIASRQVTSLISNYLDLLSPTDSFSELFLIYRLREISKVDKDSIYVGKDYIWEFWKDCVSKTKNKWSVITYTKTDETWDLGWGKTTALAIQQERIQNGCNIERTFLYDTDDELDKLEATLKEQKEIGIDVYFLEKNKFLENQVVSNYAKQLETLDIGIVDNVCVYRTYLDERRNMTGASIARSEGLKNKAEFLLREAKRMGKRYEGEGDMVK